MFGGTVTESPRSNRSGISNWMAEPRRLPSNDEVSAQYHDRMKRKWEEAARRPWSSVQADSQTSESARRSGLGWVACSCNWCKEWVKAGGVIPP